MPPHRIRSGPAAARASGQFAFRSQGAGGIAEELQDALRGDGDRRAAVGERPRPGGRVRVRREDADHPAPQDLQGGGVALAFSGMLGFTAIIMISAKIIMEDTETRLHRLAMTDHLTGVLNRRGLLEEFERIKKRSPASSRYVALVLFEALRQQGFADELTGSG